MMFAAPAGKKELQGIDEREGFESLSARRDM
jgi:hypothetical protein